MYWSNVTRNLNVLIPLFTLCNIRVNIPKLYVLTTRCIYVSGTFLRTKSNYYRPHHWLIGWSETEPVYCAVQTELFKIRENLKTFKALVNRRRIPCLISSHPHVNYETNPLLFLKQHQIIHPGTGVNWAMTKIKLMLSQYTKRPRGIREVDMVESQTVPTDEPCIIV